jgi:hypothetical protein
MYFMLYLSTLACKIQISQNHTAHSGGEECDDLAIGQVNHSCLHSSVFRASSQTPLLWAGRACQ